MSVSKSTIEDEEDERLLQEYEPQSLSSGKTRRQTASSQQPTVKTLDDVVTAFRVSIGNVPIAFQEDEQFLRLPPDNGGESEPVWDSLLPIGGGYVRFSPSDDKSDAVSTVSAMHQLHCLYTLRRITFSEISGHHDSEAFDMGVDRRAHAAHCFDYLRQAIMCSADSTLEPFELPDSTTSVLGTGFPGAGFARQCRNYTQLKSWAEEHRAFDVDGFIQGEHRHGHPPLHNMSYHSTAP